MIASGFAVLGVIAFSFAIALGLGALTDEIRGDETKGGYVFVLALISLLVIGLALI